MVIGEATLKKRFARNASVNLTNGLAWGGWQAGWAGQQLRKRPTSMSTSRWDVTDSRWHIRIARSIVGGALSAVWYCIRLDETEAVLLLAQAKALDVLATVPRGKPFMKPRFKPILRGANSRTREVRGRDCGNKVLKLGATATRRVCQAGLARVRGESKESHD